MAAGNTCKEAILQGLCEIFERYAVFEIYLSKMAPPTIDTEYFRGTEICARMKDLEVNYHLDIILKDCSLHKGLPVIGVLIIDKENHTYSFKLGADFVPYRAVERCLNEVYQGTIRFKGMPLGLFDLNEGARWEFSAADYRYYNLNRIFINGSGFWPESICPGRAEEVAADMRYPDRVFQYYDFLTCFACEACKVAGSCRFFELLKIEKKLNAYSVDQRRLERELGV